MSLSPQLFHRMPVAGELYLRFYFAIAIIFFMAAGATVAESSDRTQSVRDVYTLGSGDRA